MSKFSVKKPLTVFVAVIAILVLGVVAYFRMTPDLLPNMDFPYVLIMTTYPGASPEKVEEEITKPMEQAMSTLDHIQEVSSVSSENVGMVILEFTDSVNMDTVGVDIQQEISQLSAKWADTVGTPYVLKINPSMLPVEVAALSMKGMDTMELTDFLNDTLMNKLEGIPGVARISTSGAIEQELHVVLDQDLIDDLNRRIAAAINGELDDAAAELSEKKEELEDAQKQVESAQSQLNAGANALIQGEAQLNEKKTELTAMQEQLQEQLDQAESGRRQLEIAYAALKALNEQVNNVVAAQQEAHAYLDTLQALSARLQQLDAMDSRIAELKQENETLSAEIGALQEQIDGMDPADEGLPSLEAQLAEKQNAYNANLLTIAELEAELAVQAGACDAAMAEAGVTKETLPAQIAIARTATEAADGAVAQVDALLASQDTDRAGLAASVEEMSSQLDQLNAGIGMLESALAELENGMITIEEAQKMLNQQKTAGMLQISTGAAKLAVSSAAISQGLAQIEDGLDTIESSREDALDKADLNGIITMEMVTQILAAQNFSMPAGYVEQDGIKYMVSVGDEITDLETLRNLLLFDPGIDGIDPVRLGDVAVVMLTDNRDETYAKLNGQDGIVLSFEKQSTYATAETTNNIASRFRALEEEYPGLAFVSLMNQGDYIYLIVNTILNSLLLGAVFAILVLFLFLKDLRPTFITLCSIPISVIFAIVLMYFTGVTINMISLSGLAVAVGMLVDNSVVVIENIYRLRSKGANVIQAAVSGAKQVAGAVTASTLTTVCVFAPIVFVTGITKQLFTDLALTMSFALLASLIVSLTLVPAMASGMLRKEHRSKPGLLETHLLPLYQKAVRWALAHKPVTLIAAAVLLVVTALGSLSKGFIFMPEMDMPNVNVTVTMPENADMAQASALADEVLSRISNIDGIETVGAMMGSNSSLLGGANGGTYDVSVYITLSDDTASGAAIGRQIEQLCADMDCTVTASSAMMDMSMLTGSGISMNIYCDDMELLQSTAIKIGEALEGIEGVAEVSNGLEDAAPALHVAIDRNAAMKHGLTVAQIYMELASGLADNSTAATLELDGISTDVIIKKPEGAVLDGEALRNHIFEVTKQDGTVEKVPLRAFALVRETSSLSSINRINQRRYLSVTATLEEGYNVTLLTARAQEVVGNLDLGSGVSYIFTGENETIMEAINQLLLMLALGILLVYLVMVAQFQSLKSPFIVMFTIPLAFTGGFLALLICGMEVSVISLIGFVMLTGIIVNNGIVLVDYINQLRLEGRERREAIVEAGVTRMRPILMTTITTVLGLIDMAVRKSAGTALMKPIAVVCIGGLVYATLMTLFVVPCIYDLLNKKELRNVREEDLKLLDL
ncbi:MAG: efflux RND transporter permease subunit [Faecousia sp.]